MKFRTDEIEVEGIVTIKTPYRTQRTHNTILFNFFNSLVNNLGYSVMGSYPPAIVLGTDTSTITSPTTSTLINPLPTTYANPSLSTFTDGASYWAQTLSYTYSPVSYFPTQVTIGEIGAMGFDFSIPGMAFFSRLSVADGTFSSVTVNFSTPLTVIWTFYFKYGA